MVVEVEVVRGVMVGLRVEVVVGVVVLVGLRVMVVVAVGSSDTSGR